MLKGISAGCGFFGNIQLEGWSRVEGARIVAVVDRDEGKAIEAAARFGLAAYTRLGHALAQLWYTRGRRCSVTALRYEEIPAVRLRDGVERRLAYLDNLMMVVLDLDDGPKAEPDPPHSHPHEQVCYVAEGEILFLMGGKETRLGPGDLFLVPSGHPHTIQQLTEHVRLVDCFAPIREDFL